MPSLLEQLAAAEWMADWPHLVVPAQHQRPPAPGLPTLLAARGKVDDSHAIPVEQVRLAIAQLHEWNRAAESWLTVPPTLLGFGRAMDRLGANPSPSMAGAIALIEAAWPDLVAHAKAATMLDQAQSSAAKVAHARADRTAHAGKAAPARAGSGESAHPVTPASAASPGRGSATAEPAAGRSTAEAAKPARPAPAPRQPAPAAAATAATLVAAAMEDPDAPLAVRAERFGTFLKEKVIARTGKTWFEDILVPALAAVPDKEQLRELARVWPRDMAFSPPDPVAWVKGPSLWGPLRAAAPEVRDALMEGWLPWLVDSSGWTPSQRFAAFKCMVGWVKTDAALLDQRVALWKAWGGRPEERCGEWGREEEDAFAVIAGDDRKEPSAIEWMAAQDVPLWKAWAARATAPQAPAPAHRRPSP